MDYYLWFKTFHIFFMFAWFAGIFYLPRIYVNIAENTDNSTRERLILMSERLLRFILPMAFFALLFGFLMVANAFGVDSIFKQSWLLTKLIMAILVLLYQWMCYQILLKIKNNKLSYSSKALRLFNEIPVFFLIVSIAAAVFKVLMKEESFLAISGYDPSGGAGVIADSQVSSYFGIPFCSLLTCISNQDTSSVHTVQPMDKSFMLDVAERIKRR